MSSKSKNGDEAKVDSKRMQQRRMAEVLQRFSKEDKKTHLLHPDTMLASIELDGNNWKPTMIHARKAMENGVNEHEVLRRIPAAHSITERPSSSWNPFRPRSSGQVLHPDKLQGMDGVGLIEDLLASFVPIEPIQPYKPRQTQSETNSEDIYSAAADEMSTVSSEDEESNW